MCQGSMGRIMAASKRPSGHPAKTSDVVRRPIERDDAAGNDAADPLPRTPEEYAAALDKARSSERMRSLSEKRWASSAVPPSVPPAAAPVETKSDRVEMDRDVYEAILAKIGTTKPSPQKVVLDSGEPHPADWEKELEKDLSTEVRRARAERLKAQDEAATVEARAEAGR